ncbi:MAG: Uma2 family endonuclease [Cyanobacteria bacterium J06639_1]
MVVAPIKRLTPDEYLERERQADTKSEFIDGETIPMAGATANHNRLSLNLCRLLPTEIDGSTYELFMSDMRLWLPQYECYTYPDVMAIAGTPQFTDDKQTAVTNPCFIAKVLPVPPETYDELAYFRFYRAIPELVEHLLIDRTTCRVEHWVKVKERNWTLTEYVSEEASLMLQSVPLELSLKDLYKRVRFEAIAPHQDDPSSLSSDPTDK